MTIPAADTLSLVDFLTDGSLAALCADLTVMAGAPVTLRDDRGRRIVQADGDPPWRVLNDSDRDEALVLPVRAGGDVIGTLGVQADRDGLVVPTVERSLGHLAAIISDLCERDLELRHRSKEISVVHRLAALLAGAAGVDEMARIALDSVLETLGLDAGSLVLLERDDGRLNENEDDLALKASRNLSREWLDCPLPLSREREFDHLALSGQVVVVEDLLAEPRVLIRERVMKEGLRAFINAGLIYQKGPLGVIRLYAREPRRFSVWDRRLVRTIAQQLAVAVEQARLLKMHEDDQRIQRQLQLAADVQRRMLPRTRPRSERFDLAARWTPTFQLAGDFYDFIELDAGAVGIVVADVVGKGIAAALHMASLRASLRAHATVQCPGSLQSGQGPTIADPAAAVSAVNRDLHRDICSNEFATLWYGVADPRSGRLTYCSAGHELPLLLRAESGGRPRHVPLPLGNLVLGVDPHEHYTTSSVDLLPGDTLLAYTDGMTDARSFGGARWGRARLVDAAGELLVEKPEATAAEVLEHVFWALRQFAGLSERPDDQTLVVMRVR